MSRLGSHSRNHSFPPSVCYVQKPSRTLNKPLPDIDDEPWLHFLANSDDEDDEQYADYLHFDAGILVGSETSKRKANKFRPSSAEDGRSIIHHHGSFRRRQLGHHGFMQLPKQERPSYEWRAITAPGAPYDATHARKTARRPSVKSHSNHRHSWQEPSLFTVAEEIPKIVISDFDEYTSPSSVEDSVPTLNIGESLSEIANADSNEDGENLVAARAPESPRIKASAPEEERADAKLGQMWFAERARL